MSTANISDQAGSVRARRRAPVRWPWLVVALAWGVALLATLINQRFLIDHHWLIEESGLPWLLAAGIFLASWQVMTLAMMLPSSMPMVKMMTYAARKQSRTYLVIGVFVAGYAAVWTAFALVAFTGDTFIHRAVDSWPWLAEHYYLIGAATFAIAGIFQFTPLKERCLSACRSPLTFFLRYYRRGCGARLATGPAPRHVLPGLLLGADAGHVRCGHRQPDLDGGAGGGDGDREGDSGRAAAQSADRRGDAGAGRVLVHPSGVAGRLERWHIAGMKLSRRAGKPGKARQMGDGCLRFVAMRVVPRRENQGAIRSRPHT